jgi:hypothetical protein
VGGSVSAHIARAASTPNLGVPVAAKASQPPPSLAMVPNKSASMSNLARSDDLDGSIPLTLLAGTRVAASSRVLTKPPLKVTRGGSVSTMPSIVKTFVPSSPDSHSSGGSGANGVPASSSHSSVVVGGKGASKLPRL